MATSGVSRHSSSASTSSMLPSKHEGLLSKWTNVVRGWQHRWFVLDPILGTLDYYLTEEDRESNTTPRASIKLQGASVVPSHEDAQAFILHAANGEVYKFKAHDTKERQKWVNLLRCVISPGYLVADQSGSSISSRSATLSNASNSSSTGSTSRRPSLPKLNRTSSKTASFACEPPSIKFDEPFADARMIINKVRDKRTDVCKLIEEGGKELTPVSSDLLLLKATSLATWDCLHHCLFALMNSESENGGDTYPIEPYSILDPDSRPPSQQQQQLPVSLSPRDSNAIRGASPSRLKSASTITEPIELADDKQPPSDHQLTPTDVEETFMDSETQESVTPNRSEGDSHRQAEWKENLGVMPIKGALDGKGETGSFVEDEAEITDAEEDEMDDLDSTVESEKSVILHLIGQLKIGMDLTKVTLPTFILERRSLLEMFADYMGHASMILRVPEMDSAEQRMIAVLEWYLTSFHIVRKGTQAKKPYNPIIGETFHCSWHVPDDSANKANPADAGEKKHLRVKYVGEQVSHHPPVSAFYVECPEKEICMAASIYTQSKFYGLSIGVNMIGNASLFLTRFNEEYTFTLPSAYARSILTVPWCELGGKVALDCKKSGYSAEIVFHTKPFYGGKLHRVTAEVMNPSGKVVSKVNGEWNSTFEFTGPNMKTKTIDVSTLPLIRKRVRPIDKQESFESRRLWQKVTEALAVEDIDKATAEKNKLEEIQRTGERQRKANGVSFPNKFFHPENGAWVFNSPLYRRTNAEHT